VQLRAHMYVFLPFPFVCDKIMVVWQFVKDVPHYERIKVDHHCVTEHVDCALVVVDNQVILLHADERVFIEDDFAEEVEEDVCHHVAAVENGDELDLFQYARVMLVRN